MPLRPDLLTPIAGAIPSGANLRYDPVYDQIREARRQDDAGPQGDWQRERKTADYRLVVDLASKALAERSKDLQLAVWLLEAALNREKFPGLQQGIDLLRGLLENFWETFYPEIEDGDLEPRVNLLSWVGGRLVEPVRFTPITAGGLSLVSFQDSRRMGSEETPDVREKATAEGKPTVEDFDRDAASTSTAQYEAMVAAQDACLASLAALSALCDEKFSNDPPSFEPLRTALEEVRHTTNQILQKRPGRAVQGQETEPEPEPESVYAPEEPAAQETKPVPALRKKNATFFEPTDLDDVAPRLQAIARFLRAQDASNPAPYLLLRGYRWGELRADSADLIPPPTSVRQTIKRLAGESEWAELIEAAETAMAEPYGRAWLDLQRHVVNATEQSGYAHVAAAIRGEVRALLSDLPSLPQREFSDETPVASAETHLWLKQLANPEPPKLPVFQEEQPEPDAPDTFKLAQEAARNGRASEAIQMLAAEIPRQQSGRARFQTKLQLAQICMMTNHATLAQPILEELARSIDQHALDEWELPDVVAQPLVMLYKLQRDEAVKQKLYARISRLDPIQALECEK